MRGFGKASWYSRGEMPAAVDTAEHPAARGPADVGGRDPALQRSAEAACVEDASDVTSPVRRRNRVTQTKRHPNVFLKHKLKYKKRSSTQDESSSSTESERTAPTSGPLQVTFLPGAVAGCCSDELYCRSSAQVLPGQGTAQPAPADLTDAAAPLPAATAPHSGGGAIAAQAVAAEPSPPFFKSIPSVSSTLSSSTSSSRSSGASAEKEGSDSSDSLVSAKATQRRSLKKAGAEKEASDSSDSLASGASVTRKSIKKLIRNKYDIFRRQKLKYRRLLGKSDGRADLRLDYTGDDETAALLATTRCPASGGSGDGSTGSGSSGGSSSSSGCSSAAASGAAGAGGHHHHHQGLQLPGPRCLPHNPLLHSSSDGGGGSRSSSSSLQSSSSSSSARSSRDAGFVDKGREPRHASPATINRVVPLMVMVQRQMVAGDASSAVLMYKCNMCNMFSSMMRNVLVHISERHATAQYCFDCESFFPDSHSLDSHRAVGCQGSCSVSRTGSDAAAALPDESGDSPPLPASCRKEAAARAGVEAGAGREGGSCTGASGTGAAWFAAAGDGEGGGVASGRSSGVDVERASAEPLRCQRCEHHDGGSADVSGRSSGLAPSACSTASLGSLASVGHGSGDSSSSSAPASSSSSSCGSSRLPVISEVGTEVGKEYRCRLCSKEFLGSCYLKRHMRSHTGEKICFCPTCHRGFSEWRNLRNHIARFHGAGGGLTAHGASHSAGSDNGCGASMASSSTSGFSEAMPGEQLPLAAASSAGSTEETMDDAEQLNDCAFDPTRDGSLDADSDLLLHSTMHLGSTSSRLELNSDETFRLKALTPHDRAGGLRRTYHCEPCNKDFVTKFAMQRHLDFHADKRPFHCDMCSYKSKTKPQLKVHQMRHKGQKVYHCDLCNYDCVTHSDLNRHCKSMSHKSRHSSNVL